jgi:site-specific DNA-cytosine methylase
MAIKLLIGGSPCTHWSIAQKNNRETEPDDAFAVREDGWKPPQTRSEWLDDLLAD